MSDECECNGECSPGCECDDCDPELIPLSPGVYAIPKTETLMINTREILEFMQIEDTFENRNRVANLALKMALEVGATFEEGENEPD